MPIFVIDRFLCTVQIVSHASNACDTNFVCLSAGTSEQVVYSPYFATH